MSRLKQIFSKAILMVLVVITSGCATNTDIVAKLNTQRATHTEFKTMQITELPANQEMSLTLTDTSPVFEFDTGKSYFATLGIQSTKSLEIFVMPTGSLAFEPAKLAQIFCPRVIFLDESKGLIRATDTEVVYDRSLGFKTHRRGGTAILDVPVNTRYLVIHSRGDTPGKKVNYYNQASGFVVGSTYVREPGGSASFLCGPFADIIVRTK
jgi:glutaredoxin-related protein